MKRKTVPTTGWKNQRTIYSDIVESIMKSFSVVACLAMLLSRCCSIYCQKYPSDPFCSRNGSHNHGERDDGAALLCR